MSEAADILEREMDEPYWREEVSGARLMELIAEVRELEPALSAEKARADEAEDALEYQRSAIQAYCDSENAMRDERDKEKARADRAEAVLEFARSGADAWRAKARAIADERYAAEVERDALRAQLETIRAETLVRAIENVDFVRCGSGPTDRANDVWREACDSVEALLRSALATKTEGGSDE